MSFSLMVTGSHASASSVFAPSANVSAPVWRSMRTLNAGPFTIAASFVSVTVQSQARGSAMIASDGCFQ